MRSILSELGTMRSILSELGTMRLILRSILSEFGTMIWILSKLGTRRRILMELMYKDMFCCISSVPEGPGLEITSGVVTLFKGRGQ